MTLAALWYVVECRGKNQERNNQRSHGKWICCFEVYPAHFKLAAGSQGYIFYKRHIVKGGKKVKVPSSKCSFQNIPKFSMALCGCLPPFFCELVQHLFPGGDKMHHFT